MDQNQRRKFLRKQLNELDETHLCLYDVNGSQKSRIRKTVKSIVRLASSELIYLAPKFMQSGFWNVKKI